MHTFKPKSKARRYALQALYAWLLSDNSIHSIIMHFVQDRDFKNCDMPYFKHLVNAVATNHEELDAEFTPYLDRPLAKLDPIELTILRIATYELKYGIDAPFKVVISEAMNLANVFGSADSYKFINGVLDKLSKDIRQPVLEAQQV